MGFDIGSLRFASDPAAPREAYHVDVMNASWGDVFHVGGFDGHLPLPTGATVMGMDVDLYDARGTAFSTDALPTTAPDIVAFTDPFVYIHGETSPGEFYEIQVRVDSLSDVAAPFPEGTFEITAEAFEVYDHEQALGDQVMPGSRITGTLRIDPGTPDREPNPDIGRYPHEMQPGFGFDLTAGTLSFRTDSATRPLMVDIGNNFFQSYDRYAVHAEDGTWSPGGGRLGNIDMFLEDPDGDALKSDALSTTAPNLGLFNGARDLHIKGFAPGGGGTWYIHARVLEMRAVGKSERIVLISPEDGKFVAEQRFDAAFILPPGQGLRHLQGSVNGMPVPGSICMPLPHDVAGGSAVLCHGMHQFLMPGSNTVKWTFELTDGSVVTEWVDWILLR